jgi:hypothetical protein
VKEPRRARGERRRQIAVAAVLKNIVTSATAASPAPVKIRRGEIESPSDSLRGRGVFMRRRGEVRADNASLKPAAWLGTRSPPRRCSGYEALLPRRR